MAVNTIPPAIELLRVIAVLMDRFSDGLNPDTPVGDSVRLLLKNASPESDPEFVANRVAVGLFQVVMLAVVSLYEGVSVPALKAVVLADDQITLRWDGGSFDTFRAGIYDPGMVRASHYIARRVLQSSSSQRNQLPSRFLQLALPRLEYYKSALEVSGRRLTELRQNKITESLSGNVEPIFLFVLMSVLPGDQLSALFSFVQQFLPPDLSVTDANGKQYFIATLFRPSADVKFLIEQVAGYLELYTSPKMPIIREITRSKTQAFLEAMLQKPATANAVFANIDSILANQIQSRIGLYNILIRFLGKVAK
ncbi:hypothetical protein EBR96_06240 [bacterium]|nr:hypothetical protein [bacterium]